MKLKRLADEIERILEINTNDLEEVLSEWIPWDDQYGEDKDEDDESEPIPEGMYLTANLDVGDPEAVGGLIMFSITGTVTLHPREEEEEQNV